MAYRLTRDFYIPQGAVKVTDKKTGAVVYLYLSDGRPAAVAFHGKADKPDWRFWFRSEKEREAKIKGHFDAWRAIAEAKAKRAADRKARPIGLVVGDVLNTCWGYEQTNREFFQVIEIKGCFAILREIAQVREYDGDMSGHCVPQSNSFIGEPIRRRIAGDGVKIDDVRYAKKWNTSTVAGVAVGGKLHFTEYH